MYSARRQWSPVGMRGSLKRPLPPDNELVHYRDMSIGGPSGYMERSQKCSRSLGIKLQVTNRGCLRQGALPLRDSIRLRGSILSKIRMVDLSGVLGAFLAGN